MAVSERNHREGDIIAFYFADDGAVSREREETTKENRNHAHPLSSYLPYTCPKLPSLALPHQATSRVIFSLFHLF